MSSAAEGGASTSATPQQEGMEVHRQATELLAKGKRNLICQEIPNAVQNFQDACKILSSHHGEMAMECADAYFQYGSALLDLSRMEQGVLGNALQGVDVDADDEEGPINKDQFEETDKIEGDAAEAMGEEEDGDEEAEGEAEEGDEKAGSDAEEENADDISNLQLSWETLDLAKTIYNKDSSKESQLKAAESHLKLGEISLEEDRFTDALADMEKCLDIQKQHLEPFNRAIAETYYQMGLACQTNEDWDKAKDYFSSALTCLESKIESLQVIVTEKPPKSPSKTVEPADQAQQEIKEIEGILPDIKEKIKDAESALQTAEKYKALAKQALGDIFGVLPDSLWQKPADSGLPEKSSCSSSTSSEPQKTTNITHLIRKKRKPEEEDKGGEKPVVEDLENKKPKQEGGSGDATTNGVIKKADNSSDAMATT